MKKVTYEEFRDLLEKHPKAVVLKKYSLEERNDRESAIKRSEKIFVKSGLTDNISIAFELYQDIFAEREREIFVNTLAYGKPPNILDKYERPKCPECNTDMKLRILPANEEGINTQWVCSNQECDTVLDSKLTLEEWMGVLKKK